MIKFYIFSQTILIVKTTSINFAYAYNNCTFEMWEIRVFERIGEGLMDDGLTCYVLSI